MNRLAAVIISVVFIFTACGRHALEREVFSTAETENEVFETEEREQARNEESSWATGLCYAGAAIGVIAAVAITAAVIYKCRCNKTEPEIEKTYGIFARTKQNIRLTVQQIVDKLIENRMIFSYGMIFNLKIDSVISTDKEYLLRLFGQYSDMIAIFDRNKIGIIPGSLELTAFIGGILRIENGEIVYRDIQKLMSIKKENIETLEIIPDNPADTEFLNELIELVKEEE